MSPDAIIAVEWLDGEVTYYRWDDPQLHFIIDVLHDMTGVDEWIDEPF